MGVIATSRASAPRSIAAPAVLFVRLTGVTASPFATYAVLPSGVMAMPRAGPVRLIVAPAVLFAVLTTLTVLPVVT